MEKDPQDQSTSQKKEKKILPIQNILQIGKQVIAKESQALEKLAQELNHRFVEAVKLISNCQGKIVISGMGKAGLIGSKISATLSSLGNSSFFMHPAEAAHGDLGTLSADDVVLLLSNSGNSEEIIKIIPAIKSIGCPIIGITANDKSILAQSANVTILLGQLEEVDHLNLAPTTSTTAMLAVGDAIAIATLQQKASWKKVTLLSSIQVARSVKNCSASIKSCDKVKTSSSFHPKLLSKMLSSSCPKPKPALLSSSMEKNVSSVSSLMATLDVTSKKMITSSLLPSTPS